MLKNTIITLVSSIFLCSCVSQSDYDRIASEKGNITQERDVLKAELNEIKFGAPNLLKDGKKFYEANDFIQSRQKFQMLVEKHPDLPESIEAKKYLANIDEAELWGQALGSEDIEISDRYIQNYPKGKFIAKASARRSELLELKKKKAYEYATSNNTSSTWKQFLEDYPNHDEAAAIRKRIIRLEVDEIFGDRATGQMPSFNQYNTGYSSISTVSITNNTGCVLTVRYSGPDVEMILIPVGGSKMVSLSSGSYKVAASACGANYAGSENLNSDYRSTFTISTTRY